MPEKLPSFYYLDDCARYVLSMAHPDNDIFRPAIEDAAEEFDFKRGQMEIISQKSSPDLKKKFSSVIPSAFPSTDIAEEMVEAFWDPIVKSAALILNNDACPPDQRLAYRKLGAIHLLASIDNSVRNMRLMLNYAQHGEDDLNDIISENDPHDLSNLMTARDVFHVFKRGIVPQIVRITAREFGMSKGEIGDIMRDIREKWTKNPKSMSDLTMMRPFSAVEWMKASVRDISPLNEPQI